MARSCSREAEGVDRDRTVGVVRGVRAAVGRVRVVADLALVAVVAERLRRRARRSARDPGQPGAVDPGDDHHAVRGSTGAVGRGRVVGALGGDGVDEASPDLDDVERQHPDRRSGPGRAPAPTGARACDETVVSTVVRSPADARGLAMPVVASRNRRPASTASLDAVADPVPTSQAALDGAAESGTPCRTSRRTWSRPRSTPRTGRRQVQRRLERAPLVGRRPRGLGGIARGHQAHELGEVVGPEQQHRVDVAVADAQAEVQHAAVVVGADAAGDARPRRRGSPVARRARATDERNEYEVRRSPPCATVDVQRAGDRAGEADDAVVGGADGRAGRGGEVDAAVPGGVRRSSALERPHHLPVDRPHHPPVSSGAARAAQCRTRPRRRTQRRVRRVRRATTNARRCAATCSTHGQPRGRWTTRHGEAPEEVGRPYRCGTRLPRGDARRTPERASGPGAGRSVADGAGLALGLGQPAAQLQDRLRVDLAHPALGDAEQTRRSRRA